MIDYNCEIKLWRDDIELHTKVIKTIEDDVYIEPNKKNKYQDIEFETEELIKDLLLELLKEEFGESVELIDFESVIDNNFDIYKLTY
jgi:hypothetical protein